MVGFRVFDLGLLVLWLVWFFRLRDDGEDPPEDGGGGGGGPGQGPNESGPRDGGGMRLPLGRWRGGRRLREHGGRRAAPQAPRPRASGARPRPLSDPAPRLAAARRTRGADTVCAPPLAVPFEGEGLAPKCESFQCSSSTMCGWMTSTCWYPTGKSTR